MKENILNIFASSLDGIPAIKNSDYSFSIEVGGLHIICDFADDIFSLSCGEIHQNISYELGSEKFFTAQKGLFKNLESLMKMTNDKRAFGQTLSCWKKNIQDCLSEHSNQENQEALQKKLSNFYLETSLAETSIKIGYEHILNKVKNEMLSVFRGMGYTLVEERELEDEYHNFEALNIDEDHPAREDQDSFYVDSQYLMRTHTSSSQIRTLEKMLKNGETPPIAIVCPGVCYRRDAVDATHFPIFRQMEGLVVDKNVSFSDLKGTLLEWAKAMFGNNTKIRLRPDYFPFTEPSAELSVSSPDLLDGRWVELLGCGMVHPQVFRNVGLDPDIWKGFAFGTGIERIAMMRYGIKDIRLFFENDIRFLKQSL
ncbi:MAG: phenylalanine--tRNA ligase subunit alpha [Brevinemataceae bacterium]